MISNLSTIMQHAKNAVDGFRNQSEISANSETKNVLDSLSKLVGEPKQKIHDLTQSVSGLNQAKEQLETFALGKTSEAINTVRETTKQATVTAKQAAEQTTGILHDATNAAAQKLNDATISMTQTAEKTKTFVDATVQQAGQKRAVLSGGIQDFVVTSTEAWVAEHPLVSWFIAHPLWTIALALLTLFLTWSLLGAIVQMTQQAFLSMLQAPFKLTQSLLRSAFQSLKRADSLPLTQLDGEQKLQKRLIEILSRLESLRQEEEALMKEMQSILLSKH